MSGQKGRSKRSTAELAAGIHKSLEAANQGLTSLLQSLEASGMAEGVRNYRMLQATLVQQRLWAHEHGQTQLVPQFQKVGGVSAKLHRIFSAYAETMKLLAEIENLR